VWHLGEGRRRRNGWHSNGRLRREEVHRRSARAQPLARLSARRALGGARTQPVGVREEAQLRLQRCEAQREKPVHVFAQLRREAGDKHGLAVPVPRHLPHAQPRRAEHSRRGELVHVDFVEHAAADRARPARTMLLCFRLARSPLSV